MRRRPRPRSPSRVPRAVSSSRSPTTGWAAPTPVAAQGSAASRTGFGLYFVACEALANVAKYAQATAVSVSVARTGGGVAIEIADDGVGGARRPRLRPARACGPRRGARRSPARHEPGRRGNRRHRGRARAGARLTPGRGPARPIASPRSGRPCRRAGSTVVVPLAQRRERVDRRRVVRVARVEPGRRERLLVRRVGIVLRLQRQPVTLAVGPAARAVERAVEEVARVELDPRLGGPDLERAAARGSRSSAAWIMLVSPAGRSSAQLWS